MKSFLLIVPVFTLFCFCSASEDYLKVLENVGDLNEKWLQAFSVPQMAVLLQRPPYSYFFKELLDYMNNVTVPDVTVPDVKVPDFVVPDISVSDILKTYNESRSSWQVPKDGRCSDDILQIFYNLGSDWALQMLDSSGKLSSGVLKGSITWPGHFEECNSVYSPEDDKGHGGFYGKYCVTTWSVNLTEKFSNLPLTIGLCFPDSCPEKQIKNLGTNLLKVFNQIPELNKVSSLMALKKVSCKLKEKSLDMPSIIYLVLISCFLSLSAVGSVIAILHHRRNHVTNSTTNSEVSTTETIAVNSNVITLSSEASSINSSKTNHLIVAPQLLNVEEASNDTASLTQNPEFGPKKTTIQRTIEPVWKRILMCFSVIDNGKKILSVGSSEGQLLSVHGIRFLSLTWVILGHTYIESVPIIGNKVDVLKEMDSFSFQVLLQAPFSVDSFFLLSGFLLTYLFCKEADKRKGKINWVYFYLHRLWRLTPVYMVVVFFYTYIFKYLGSGPFWDDTHCDADRSSWWKYLLYISNFIPINDMCVGWSWYLANDMQFYVISPLFLYPLWRWPIIGISLIATLLIGTWTTTAILSNIYDVTPLFVGVTEAKDLAAYQAKMWDSYDLIYDKPYCRIAPYLIGVIVGFMLYKINQRKNFLNWCQQVLGWTIACFCSLSVIFGLYHVEISKNAAMFYNALSRSSFSIGLGWLIFACETGHGGFITKLLSWKAFIPLSRLTYCAYLVHPILIHAFYQGYQTELFFTQITMVTNGMGFIFISFGLAFLFSITFESPLMNLEKLLLKSKRH